MGKRGNDEGSVYFDSAKGVYVGAITVGRTTSGRPKRRKFHAPTRAEAVARMDAARDKLRRGLPIPDERLTVGKYLNDWADRRLPGTVSDGTEDTYKRTIRLYLIPKLGAIQLAHLEPADVTELMREMEQSGKAGETRRLARAVLRRALRHAEQDGIVARNVAAIADGPRIRRKEKRSLTPDEARRLLAAAKTDRLEAAYVLLLALGLRRGEVLGLAWADVDFEGDVPKLTVRQQLLRDRKGPGLVISDVKTAGSRRTMHLPAPVVDVIRAHKARQAAERLVVGPDWKDTAGLVFTTPLGTPVHPDNFYHCMDRLSNAAGLGHWSPHELRHSCASLLLAMLVPLEVVSESLGHSSIRVTKDVYGHLMAPARAAAADAMGEALWGNASTSPG